MHLLAVARHYPEALHAAKVDPRASCAIRSSTMSVAEIVKEVPKLSLDEMKEVARALREAMEDTEDLADVLAVLENPGTPIPMADLRKKYGL